MQVLAERYGSTSTRPYVRISELPPLQDDFKARVIAAMGAEPLRRLASMNGVPCAPALSGVYDFSDTPLSYGQRMNNWLRTSPEGTILMCHPAKSVEANDSIGRARVNEYNYLAGAEFQNQLKARGIELARGSRLYKE
jgi:hypothetical protein